MSLQPQPWPEVPAATAKVARKAFRLRAGGRARTDSTHVLAAVRSLNRLEFVGETMRAALEALAVAAPGWLTGVVEPGWDRRYQARVESYRLPASAAGRAELAVTVGRDGFALLTALGAADAPVWLREVPAVDVLRLAWVQQYHRTENADGGMEVAWREDKDLPPGRLRLASPYDLAARYGVKRGSGWVGYKVHLTETCDDDTPHVITNVETTNATVTDQLLERLRVEQATDAWKKRYDRRAGVEGTMRQATAVTGIRHARYHGQDKNHLAHVLAATAVNIVRLDAWWTGTPTGRTRTTHFSTLVSTAAA